MVLSTAKGTYVLVLRSSGTQTLTIGKLGTIAIERGYYLYVGSAFGPGGVKARVGRHLQQEKTKRWHIDYLSCELKVCECWITYDINRVEHQWAHILQTYCSNMVKGFGCSDCRCASHLCYSDTKPKLEKFTKILKQCRDDIRYFESEIQLVSNQQISPLRKRLPAVAATKSVPITNKA